MIYYIFPLLFSTALGLFLALFITRNRLAPGARPLVSLLLAAALWSAGYAAEIASQELNEKLFWAKVQYFGITAIPLAWFYFATQYLGSPVWLLQLRRYMPLLWVIPGVTLALVWTNELHHLVWREVSIHITGSLQMLEPVHGSWFWVYWVFGYILLILGSVSIVRRSLSSALLHRWQIALVLVAILIPWFGNLVYSTGLSPVPGLDWTPFSFTVAGLLFTISLFRFHLVDILPIAQRAVFAGLADCLLVLDRHSRIIDLNPAAQKMMGNPGEGPFGKPLAQVLPELANWVAPAGLDEAYEVEVVQGEAPEQRFYELRVSPLSDRYKATIGRLIVCHEITQHKQAQAALEQVRAQLEETVLERTEELRQAVEQLQHELAQRTLAEERFAEVVEAAPDALIVMDTAGSIILINLQAERLFGYTKSELVGQNIECLIPMHQRERYRRYLRQYVANALVEQISFGEKLAARRKDGSKFPVEISLGRLNIENGFWLACIIRDISERIKAEQAQNQLIEEIKLSHEQLSALTFRLQEVQEFERRQIATELHDRVGQNLTGLNLNLQIVENQLTPESNAAVRNRLVDSLKLVEETMRQVRGVMADLRPPMLDEYGLVSTLHWYCRDLSQRTGITIRVIGNEFEPRLSPEVELILFRLVQEALNNVAKHAQATQVIIQVDSSEESACLKVEDDGLGFDPQGGNAPPEEPHWGLLTMQQRAASVGGQLLVHSVPGRGTRVSVAIPRSKHED